MVRFSEGSMASIKDVAKLAGVSVMTASRVMNGNGSVTPEFRERVRDAAARLDYRPNLTARSLRSSRTRLLGLLVPDIENPTFAALAKYVEEEAEKRGYNVVLGNTWENASREAEYYEIMLARRTDGILVAPVSGENGALFRACPAPVVTLDRSFTTPAAPALLIDSRAGVHAGTPENAPARNPVSGLAAGPANDPINDTANVPVKTAPFPMTDEPPSVTVDNRAVGRLAAEHLLALGHRHFVCLTGPLRVSVFAERLLGFQETLEAASYSVESVHILEATGQIRQALALGESMFASPPASLKSGPLAVFCATDVMALGVMKAAAGAGFAVPHDISVVGVDDIPAGLLVSPALTTVRQPIREMAVTGTAMLVGMLEEDGAPRGRRLLHPELVPRESTAPFASRKPIVRRTS